MSERVSFLIRLNEGKSYSIVTSKVVEKILEKLNVFFKIRDYERCFEDNACFHDLHNHQVL